MFIPIIPHHKCTFFKEIDFSFSFLCFAQNPTHNTVHCKQKYN
ncbi:hypothetical protein RUMCAL_00628 [Ruminococcus callidus ATCC 27760]|uniref:Uncharacterized protein n=1 Tax=Ruminococcus callidus ATCC 27760 TaxID=411473 RepID=U2KY19_9FIRM|nr:hypothetical protein RUMCAL_00628 [Ruminococcus callidus ATCC 27760]